MCKKYINYFFKIKVANINNRPNQFIIDTEEGLFFQSYKSLIAFINNEGQVFLDKNYWDYSSTTGRYRNVFLGEDIHETRRKIRSGEYKLVALNTDLVQ